MAERVGFEPTIPLQVCRISSAVHSTTLPPLRSLVGAVMRGVLLAMKNRLVKFDRSAHSMWPVCADKHKWP